MGNGLINAYPLLRTRGIDVERWLEVRYVVKGGQSDRGDLRIRFALRKQRGAAVRAKTAGSEATTAGANGLCFRRTHDLEIGSLDDDA